MAAPPAHVYQVYIRCTPQSLWRAITEGEMTRQYFHHTTVVSDWRPGSPVTYYTDESGGVAAEGTVLEADPPLRLQTTWAFRFNPDVAADPPTRVTWEIQPIGDMCRLTVTHDDFHERTATYETVAGGWVLVLSSLKSFIETGEGLPMGA